MGTSTVDIHRARFARFYELFRLFSLRPSPAGVLLGTKRVFLLFKQFLVVRPTKRRREIGNLLIVAPTRSGKSLLATSQLLSWKHSVLVNDVKGELFQGTAGYRSQLGKVCVIDPQGYGHRYDPIRGKQTE